MPRMSQVRDRHPVSTRSGADLPPLPPLGRAPLVSVLIVNYNYERYLAAAIESVLRQSYQHFEIVICDDGSRDNSRAVIAAYAERDQRIRYIFKENAAVAAALNDAFAACTGEIVTMLDADDLFTTEKLERVVERFSHGGRVGLVLNFLTKINSDEQTIGKIPEFGSFDRGELRDQILRSGGQFSAAPTSGMSMRRECAARVFPIPEAEFRTEADAYMRTVAALYYAVDVIEEPLTVYRIHSTNVTASAAVDLQWCERGISAAQRVFRVLQTAAEENGWQLAPLENSASYCEMVLIRDWLRGAGINVIAGDARRLNRAAALLRGGERRKTVIRAMLLSVAAVLPRVFGRPLIEAVYLPGGLKGPINRWKALLNRRRR
jgi:glycosyltransferase involved in cell wall biosynthesis